MRKLIIIALVAFAGLKANAQQDLTLYNARYLQQASFTNAAFTPECNVTVGGILFGSTYIRGGSSGITRRSISNFIQGPDDAVKSLDRMKDLNYLEVDAGRDIIHFGFRVKEKNYFSLNASVRTFNTLTYARDAATLMIMGNGASADDPGNENIPAEYLLLGNRANLDGTGVQSITYGEIGLQYARKFLEDDKLSIGIRPKLLLGLANMNTAESTLGVTTDANTFGITIDGSYLVNNSIPIDQEDSSFSLPVFSNLGFGIDLGASFDITEKMQVSASVNNLGFINWKNEATNYSANGGSFEFRGALIDGSILDAGTAFDSLGTSFAEDLLDSLNSQFGVDTTNDNYRTNLPARYNLGFNYQLTERANVGVLMNAYNIKKQLRAAFTLSYNYRIRKAIGFHANYSINNRSFANLGLGFSFNIKSYQLYAMSDNMLFFLPNATNMHVRGGINWTFGCSNDKDKDGIKDKDDDCPETPGEAKFKGCPDTDKDGVMDKEDKCPETPGSEEFAGCPDRDGDKIPDLEDECPDAPGVAEFKGCPDTDQDGIQDSEDACPTIAGIAEFNGCPDTDKDGIQDSEDECPEQPGISAFNGCPDTDADGIKDSEDACPEKPGTAQFQGCPDTDKDGLPDNKDNCPDVAGPIDNKGCPFGDRDGDGIIDKDDSCPDTPGPVENAGCPYSDLDGDGVYDKDDRCPQTPGVVENQGCPEIKQEEQEVLNTAFSNLEFETGKDVIKTSSFESLDKLAELLIKKTDWKLEIAGHTDDVGSEASNLALSEKRSKAVGKYLESKGVPVTQLIVKWFGESKPIADNSTAEGRAQNRRVELKVIFD